MTMASNEEVIKMMEYVGTRTENELWALYGITESEFKKRDLIRTRNSTSERGERVAVDIYQNIRGEPKLQLAPPVTKNVDALSRDGERYSIKTVRYSKTTGTFQADDFSKKMFEYLVIVFLDDYYQPIKVLEATWDVVNEFKTYDKTKRAYKVNLSNKFQESCRVVFST